MPLCPHLEESEGILGQVVDAYPGVRSPSNPYFELPLPFTVVSFRFYITL